MPFSALLDGEPVISLLMSDAQWAAAKAVSKAEEERLLVGFTHLPGFARTSSTGLRHFAHRQGYAPDYEWAESAEHLALKAELVRAVAALGWHVDTEVPSGPERAWIADVLAERGGRRVALEVQWSKQSAAEYVRRTERYAAAGIECAWFIRHVPDLTKRDVTPEIAAAYKQVLTFPLHEPERLSELIAKQDPGYPAAMTATVTASSKGVALGRKVLPVGELAGAVLANRVHVRTTFSIVVYAADCQHCRKPAAYWLVEGVTKRERTVRPEQDPQVLAGAQRAAQILDPALPLASPQARKDSSGLPRWPAFACPHCGSLQRNALELVNLKAAAQQGRGLRFEVPTAERWEPFLSRWGIRVQPGIKLSQSTS